MTSSSTHHLSHMKALLRKNWIIWKRSWFVSLLEIAIPVLLVAIMLGIRAALPVKDIAETTYIGTRMDITYDGTLDASDLQYIKNCNADENGGKVALAPSGDSLITDLKTIFDNAGFDTKLFDSNTAIDAYTSQDGYGNTKDLRLCFAVVINKNNPNNQYEYSLRFNISDDTTDIPNTDANRVDELVMEDIDSFNDYARSGFLVVQNLIDNLIIRKETVNTANIQASVTSRTVEAHKQDDLVSNLVGNTRLFLDLPLRLPYLRFLNAILREKEHRIREGMKIMGLQNSAFYFSWIFTYIIIFTIISLIITILLAVGLFEMSSFGLLFAWHWEYSMCLLMMAFFLSVFFNNARRGNTAGLVISVVLGFVQAALTETTPSGVLAGLSFIPPVSIGLSGDQILRLEGAQVGLTSKTVGKEIMNYKMTYHYQAMAIMIFIFLILGSYLDQVLPSEFGIKKHPLFFLKKIKNLFRKNKSYTKTENHNEEDTPLQKNANYFEDVEPVLKAQDQSNESVKVERLRKVFGSKTAVNGVAFSMYKNQIFALLGHNGAGKTTTISMITGLIEPTAGTTKVFGKDITLELDEIRKSMGICPQHDVLFDTLTVKEHLELFAVFKGMNKKNIPQEVDKIIYDIGLSEKRNYLAKNLSGGQKRKLSVGIAFIGGSKFILLDEPSSGIDTFARRKLWDMLKNYKQDRVILLTTHFMDEADYLGDRIGIMADGQLKCLGSSLFLKTRFGVGYSLTLIKKDINTVSKPIIQLIQEQVKSAKVTSDVSAELTLQLPLEESSQFQDLFNSLDQNLEKLGVSSYGISVTTLEEVFLNVAHLTKAQNPIEKKITPEAFAKPLDNETIKHKRIRNQWFLFREHFKALSLKRWLFFKRDKRSLVVELILPVLIAIIGITSAPINSDVKSLYLSDNLYTDRFTVDYNSIIPPSTAVDSTFIDNFNKNDFLLNPISTATTAISLDQDILHAQDGVFLRLPCNVFGFFVEELDQTNQKYQYKAIIDTRAQEAAPFAMNKINNAILKYATGNDDIQIKVIVAPFEETEREKTVQSTATGGIYAFSFALAMSFVAGSLIAYIVKEREANAKHQQIVSGVSIPAYWYSNFFVDYLKYLVPAIICALLALAFNASALIDNGKYGCFILIFLLYGLAIIPFTYLTSFLFKAYGGAQVASFFFNFATGYIAGLAVSILKMIDSTKNVALVLQWILRPLPSFTMTYGFLNVAYREVYFIVGTEDSLLDVFDIRSAGGDLLFLAIDCVLYTSLLFLVEHLKNKRGVSNLLSRESRVPYVPKKLDDDVEKEMKDVAASDNKTYSIKVDKLRKVYSLGKGKNKVAVDRLSFGVKNGECFALLGVNGAGKTTTFKMLSGDVIQSSGDAYINGFEIPNRLNEARHEIGYCPQFDALLENLTAKEHLNLYAAIKGIPPNLREKCVQNQLVEMNLKQYENSLAGTYSGGNKRKLSVAIAMIGDPSVVFLDEPSTGMDPEARRFMWNVISRISKERKQSSVILTTHSMEEAEALATKMGIMVNGNLKCLGTSQHIKNKFGGGYEVEVKLNLPTPAQVKQTIESLGYQTGGFVEKIKVDEVIERLGVAQLKQEITKDGTGSMIFGELQRGRILVNLLVEWILIEKNGSLLKAFLTENFGEVQVLEHFQAFYRFKIAQKISIGGFFGLLEMKKLELNILQYSFCQSTIEQIFNAFAAEEEVRDDQIALNIKN